MGVCVFSTEHALSLSHGKGPDIGHPPWDLSLNPIAKLSRGFSTCPILGELSCSNHAVEIHRCSKKNIPKIPFSASKLFASTNESQFVGSELHKKPNISREEKVAISIPF